MLANDTRSSDGDRLRFLCLLLAGAWLRRVGIQSIDAAETDVTPGLSITASLSDVRRFLASTPPNSLEAVLAWECRLERFTRRSNRSLDSRLSARSCVRQICRLSIVCMTRTLWDRRTVGHLHLSKATSIQSQVVVWQWGSESGRRMSQQQAISLTSSVTASHGRITVDEELLQRTECSRPSPSLANTGANIRSSSLTST